MSAHDEQIATYHDGTSEVLELRCTSCRVVVEKFRSRPSEAQVQQRIREAWERHSTPPAEPSYEI